MGLNVESVPQWFLIDEMAREYHTPPWVIEEQCSELWWERWLARRAEQQRMRESQD